MKKIKKWCAGALVLTLSLSLLSGCGTKGRDQAAKENVDLKAVWTAISEKIGEDQLAATMELTADNVKDLYGIPEEDLAQFVAYMPMMNVKAEEFFLAEAKDEKAEEIVDAFENRQKTLDEQWKQYLPDQYELVQNYKLIQNGNYILFAVSENADEAVEIFNQMTS